MKKIIAVLMAVLMAFSALSVVAMAEEATGSTETVVDENKNIVNDDGLVFPENFTQLEFSIIFKLFEKVFSYIFDTIESLFGDLLPDLDLDGELATEIGGLGDDISNRIEQVFPTA